MSYFTERAKQLGLDTNGAKPKSGVKDSYFTKRAKELGLDVQPQQPAQTPAPAASDFFTQRQMDLGIIPDTRKPAAPVQTDNMTPFDANPITRIESQKQLFAPKTAAPGMIQTPQLHYPTTPVQLPPMPTGINMIQEYNKDHNIQSAADWLAQEQAKRDANAPQGGIGGFLYRNIADPIARSAELMQAYTPGLADFQQAAGKAQGIQADTAPITGGAIGKVAGFLGNLAGSAVNPAALEQSAATGAGKIATGALQKYAPNLNAFAQRALGSAAEGAAQNTALTAAQGKTSLPELGEAAAYGAGGGALFEGLGTAIGKLFKRNGVDLTPEQIAADHAPNQPTLALPVGRTQPGINILPKGEEPILGGSGATTARVQQRVNPYREKYNELIGLAHNAKFTPGRELEELDSLWSQIAGPQDPGLDELIKLAHPTYFSKVEPGLAAKARANQRAREVAGAPFPVRTAEERLGVAPNAPETANIPTVTPKPIAKPNAMRKALTRPPVAKEQRPVFKANEEIAATSSKTVLDRPMVDDVTKVRATKTKPVTDEVTFARRLREDQTLPKEVRDELERNKVTGARTTNEAQRIAAARMIEKGGVDKVYSDLMKRRGNFNPVETTAAQMLTRHFSDSGDVQRAIDLASKTGKGGREMGQALQALTQWNRLSQEGALLAAEQQLNRRVRNTDNMQSLTPEQASTVIQPAKGLEQVQAVNQMAKDVAAIIASKKPGEKLTDQETAILKKFQEDSKRVNEQIKPFLQDKIKQDKATIKRVGAIKPQNRTRDQVKNYLQAQADQARQELRAKRNIGFAQKVGTPDIVLYSKIAASHIANGAVKFADFAEQMVKEGITDKLQQLYTVGVRQFRKDNGLPSVQELDRLVGKAIKDRQMDEDTAHSLQALASEIGFYTDKVKVELTQDLQRAIKNIGNSTFGEKLASAHTQGMLLNIPSFGRNVIGTIQQLTLEKMAKVAASPIDWTISKLVTGERTVHLFSNNQEGFVRNFMAGSKASWNGVDPRGMLDAYGLQPNVFKGKYNPFKYTEKLLGASLGGIDGSAYYSAYGDVMATYATELGKKQGLSSAQIKASLPDLMNQLDDRVHAIADEAGLYANLQDETILSMMATRLKKGLNMPTDFVFRKARESGIIPESASLEGFGAGDILLKFAKTPANLVMRGLDYSPLGFMRSLGQLISLIPKQGRVNFNQRNFSMTLGRAITGSLGLTGLGYYLAKNGILTGASSADADVRSLQEQSGQAPYQINWSALGRFIYSGLDPEAAKPQSGDQMMKYDWLQPAAIAVSMGVDAALYEPKDNEGMATRVGHSLLAGMRSVLENPMLQGVKKISDAFGKLKTQQDSSGFTDIVKGVPASFIPSALGQVRRGGDNLKRETRAEGFWEGALNQIKNKIPGMQEQLPVSYDSLGRPREYVKGSQAGFMQYLNALTNPTQMSKYAISPDAKIVLDLMNGTNDTSILPRVAGKSIQVTDPETKKKKSITLTGDQYSRLQKDVGTRVSEQIMRAQKFFTDPKVSSAYKIDRMKDILSDQGSMARESIKKELGYRQ